MRLLRRRYQQRLTTPQYTALAAGIMITKVDGNQGNRFNLAGVFKLVFFLAWVTQIIVWIVYSLDGFKSNTRMVSSISVAVFSGATLLLALIQGFNAWSPFDVDTNETFPKVEILQRSFGLLYLVAAVVFLNNGYILDQMGLADRISDSDIKGEIALLQNDDAWHTMLFVSSQITLYTLGICLSVTESANKKTDRRSVLLLCIALVWIIVLGLDAGTASIEPSHRRFYTVNMASAGAHLVFAFMVTVRSHLPVRLRPLLIAPPRSSRCRCTRTEATRSQAWASICRRRCTTAASFEWGAARARYTNSL